MDAVVSGQGVNDTPRLHHRSPPTSSWLSSSSTATSNAHEKCSTNEISKTSHLIANNFMLFRRRFVDPRGTCGSFDNKGPTQQPTDCSLFCIKAAEVESF